MGSKKFFIRISCMCKLLYKLRNTNSIHLGLICIRKSRFSLCKQILPKIENIKKCKHEFLDAKTQAP